MTFFIQIKDNFPVNNPAYESTLMAAFGKIPNDWQPCEICDRPTPGIYQIVSDAPFYERINITWVMRWSVRAMTLEEKKNEKIAVINSFNNINEGQQLSNWDAWVFDEDTCRMTAPFPRPASLLGKLVFWCGADFNWKEAPVRPDGNYKFDFFAWQWVAV